MYFSSMNWSYSCCFGIICSKLVLNGETTLKYFANRNGVRQGGIRSSNLFCQFVNNHSDNLKSCMFGCYIDDICCIY